MKLILILAILTTLCACDQGSDSGKTQAASPQAGNPPGNQPGNQNRPPVPPTPPPSLPGQTPQPGEPPIAPIAPPEMSFVLDEYVANEIREVLLELKLSKASEVPVVADVALIDGSATYGEDYWGFKDSGSEIHQTVIFAPQQTIVKLPRIKIPRHGNCNVEFSAQILKNTVQQAEVKKDLVRILIPCL